MTTTAPVNLEKQLERFGPERCERLDVDSARRFCRALATKHYENFSVLSRLVPDRWRDDFAAVYAFCRWADDLGDEVGSTDRALELLAWWRRQLDLCYADQPEHPVFIALQPTIQKHDLPRQPFDDLITAFEQDQRVTRYETWDQLIGYCALSADPVGRLVLMVGGAPRTDEYFQPSDAICTALQLTNHLQDVKRDLLERDRIYLPSAMMPIDAGEFERQMRQSAERGFADPAFLSQFRAVVRDGCERTWKLYERGEALLAKLNHELRPIVWLFAAGGQHVLRKIELWNYETMLDRPALTKWRKLALIAKATMAGRRREQATGAGCVSALQTSNQVQLLDDAMRYCRRVTRQRARNFYYGLCLLPRKKRYALYTIYAWMRRADDLVDDAESNDSAHERLIEFQQRTADVLNGGVEQIQSSNGSEEKLLWPALQHVNERFTLDARRFQEMIDGQLSDLRLRHCETMDDLLHYCHLVASTVGLICIDIWGYHDDRAPQLATDCGVAFQLTNILRDYREDYDAGRVYLPAETFRRHGLSAEDLYHWRKPAACEAMMRELIDCAEQYYDRSQRLPSMISMDCRPTLRVMTGIYHALLERISDHPQSIAGGARIRLSSFEKITIVGGALWKQRGANRATASAST